MHILNNVALSDYTTFQIGGKASYFANPNSLDELRQAVHFAKENALPIFILGAGSNLLVSDKGFGGLVIKPGMKQIRFSESGKDTLLTADAGCRWDDVVAAACEKNLSGIEALSGIPSSAGGAVVQNIGAYGQEISNTLVCVEVYDTKTDECRILYKPSLKMQYRQTALKNHPEAGLIVLNITLQLTHYQAAKMTALCKSRNYANIVQSKPKTASAFREIILENRNSKSLCTDADNPDARCAGCFFTNPIVPQVEGEQIIAFCKWELKCDLPTYEDENGIKLSAAWLIEHAGFSKGFRLGNAAISHAHSLVITNPGNATCEDVLALANLIVKKVYDTFKVTLMPEVVYLAPEGIQPVPLNSPETNQI